jgi:phenylacetic acid degradation operon negative regulatory protein
VTQVGPADAADRPAEPVSSRRPEERAESARSLLLTVLGELVLPAGGTAWTSSLIEVMARLGFEEKACRQALLRMASADWLVPERVGRRTRWTLTPGALRSLAGGTDRIFGFARFSPDWDRQWLLVLVLARAPEADHRARHVLRSRLAWLGLGSPMPGVYCGRPASSMMPGSSRAGTSAAVRSASSPGRRGTWPRSTSPTGSSPASSTPQAGARIL